VYSKWFKSSSDVIKERENEGKKKKTTQEERERRGKKDLLYLL
jgi:hypothetical protein